MIPEHPSDLSVDAFLVLYNHFVDGSANPIPYNLRDKLNTQDDPLDDYIFSVLNSRLQDGATVKKSNGPLISPDLVIYRRSICNSVSREEMHADSSIILGLEIKKLERQPSGNVARASGLDYNTTPPCGTIRIYGLEETVLDIKGYYLFVCQEPVLNRPQTYELTALTLCDGDLLNADFKYYTSIIGRRSKEIGLGTYGDGANRIRPMLIFSNPLGAKVLNRQLTLIHSHADLETKYPSLRKVGVIERTVPNEDVPGNRVFHCYRYYRDFPEDVPLFRIRDPFPTPNRSEKTVPRGRFVIDVRPPC